MAILHPVEIKNELKLYPFFQGFPDETLLLFSTMVEVKNYDSGDVLLRQGEKNENLFFLRTGELEIVVDNEIVSKLFQKGEILGEMSLATGTPIVATVRASTECSVFEVGSFYLKTLPEADKHKFEALMHKVLTHILIERILKTNEKAKRFEIANRELQDARASLESLNKNLENEIARRSKELVEKVRDLTESNLVPVLKSINQTHQNEPLSLEKDTILTWSHSLTEVVDLLKPVVDLTARSGKMSFHKVHLCDPSKKQQTLAKLALGGTGVALTISANETEVLEAMKLGTYDLTLVDSELRSVVPEIRARNPKTEIVMLLNHDLPRYFDLLKSHPEHRYFVSRDLNNRTFTIKSIATTVAKILNRDIFGMEKYLSWGAHVQELRIKSSTERSSANEKVLAHFQNLGVRSTFLDQVQTITEEMLMNAIYDAPTGPDGKSIYNHLPRTETVNLTDEQTAQLRFATDGVVLAVSVTDPFGSLNKNILQSYLEKNHLGHDTQDSEKGGAGRGLHMILTNSDLVIFNIRPKKKTEVICLINLEKSKDVESQSTFHIFIESNSAHSA